MSNNRFEKPLKETPAQQPRYRLAGLNLQLWSAEDVAAFYYGRLLMLRDERKRRATERRYANNDDLDHVTLQELQLSDELAALADNHAVRADLIARHLLRASDAAVQRVGHRVLDRLKQRAAELA